MLQKITEEKNLDKGSAEAHFKALMEYITGAKKCVKQIMSIYIDFSTVKLMINFTTGAVMPMHPPPTPGTCMPAGGTEWKEIVYRSCQACKKGQNWQK